MAAKPSPTERRQPLGSSRILSFEFGCDQPVGERLGRHHHDRGGGENMPVTRTRRRRRGAAQCRPRRRQLRLAAPLAGDRQKVCDEEHEKHNRVVPGDRPVERDDERIGAAIARNASSTRLWVGRTTAGSAGAPRRAARATSCPRPVGAGRAVAPSAARPRAVAAPPRTPRRTRGQPMPMRAGSSRSCSRPRNCVYDGSPPPVYESTGPLRTRAGRRSGRGSRWRGCRRCRPGRLGCPQEAADATTPAPKTSTVSSGTRPSRQPDQDRERRRRRCDAKRRHIARPDPRRHVPASSRLGARERRRAAVADCPRHGKVHGKLGGYDGSRGVHDRQGLIARRVAKDESVATFECTISTST